MTAQEKIKILAPLKGAGIDQVFKINVKFNIFPNHWGIFKEQERVVIPMPKSSRVFAIISLCRTPQGWRYSLKVNHPMGGSSSGISMKSPGKDTREDALICACAELKERSSHLVPSKIAHAFRAAVDDFRYNEAGQKSLF
jgi:hypothetical protein